MVFITRLFRFIFGRCKECGRPFRWDEVTVSIEGMQGKYHETCFTEYVKPRVSLEFLRANEKGQE